MQQRSERAESFHALHVKGDPLVLFNAWDAGSARAVAEAGAKAIATGSWSVAAAHGFADGEALPLELATANLDRIVAAVDLPVTMDIEGGYGESLDQVRVTIQQVIAAGAVGVNFEDGVMGTGDLHSVEKQAARIRALRETANTAGVGLFINARTDVYLNTAMAEHGRTQLEEALLRADAYAAAGASGFFVPGLVDIGSIRELCERSPLPVNVMMMPGAPPPAALADAGVTRISHGPGPYRLAMKALKDAAEAALRIG